MIGNKQQMWKAVQNFKNRKAFEEKQNHFIVQKLISIRISFYFWNLEFLSFFFCSLWRNSNRYDDVDKIASKIATISF